MAEDDKSTVAPKLRFPEFRAGKAWDTEPMGKLYSFMKNNALSRDKLNYDSGSVKNIHYGDIHTKFSTSFDITKERVPYVNESEQLPPVSSVDYCVEGDLIFADASEDMNDVGKSMEIVRLNGERLLSGQHTILARRSDGTLIKGFGGHLFRSGRIRSQIQREAQGTKVYAISATRLSNIEVAFPREKNEQQKITACLTSLDEMIAGQERKVETLKAHKNGLMQQLFPGKGETLPCHRFPEFRDAPEWGSINLASICQIHRGKFSHRPRNDPKFFDGPYPFIQTGDVVRADGGAVVASQSLNELGLSVSKLFKPTIVLITIAANIGDTAILESEACFTDSVVGLIPRHDRVTPRFLESIVRRKKDYLNQVATTGAQKNINNEILAALTVMVPSIDEQSKIEGCLSSLATEITAETEKLTALKTHKKGLMQQLFPSPGGD